MRWHEHYRKHYNVMVRHHLIGRESQGYWQNPKSWMLSPVIIISSFTFLAAPGHLAFVFDLSSRTHFDWCVLQCYGLKNYSAATLHISEQRISKVLSNLEKKTKGGTRQNGCTFNSSSIISGWTRPWTDSPLMWVIRSPVWRPASWAGLPSSTLW